MAVKVETAAKAGMAIMVETEAMVDKMEKMEVVEVVVEAEEEEVPSSLTPSILADNGTQGGKVMTGTAKIPDSLKGQVYAIVTNSNETVNDENTVAGPAVLIWDYNSAGNVTRQIAPAQ